MHTRRLSLEHASLDTGSVPRPPAAAAAQGQGAPSLFWRESEARATVGFPQSPASFVRVNDQ